MGLKIKATGDSKLNDYPDSYDLPEGQAQKLVFFGPWFLVLSSMMH